MDANEDRPTWYVTLLGGTRRRGNWRMPRDMRTFSVVGGADLDLTDAEVPDGAVLTKISLIGGVSLRVPADVEVEVEGFRVLGGTRIESSSRPGPATRTVRVRAYGLIGGVHVER